MTPINVLDLRDTHEIGGPGKTILETYRAIDHSRFNLHLGVFRRPDEREDTPFLRAARAIGLPIHEIRARGAYDIRQVWRLAALVRQQQFHIVHPHEVSSNVVTLAMSKLHSVPIVSTAHGWFANSPKERFMVGLDKRVLRRFDRVIAVSERIRQDLLDAGVPASKLTLLHNAIVLDRYRRSGAAGALEALVGRPLQRPVLVSIGRLSPEKGHADFVDALAIVAARGRRVTAVMAGDGPSRAELETRIRGAGLEGWVHLPGYVRQPARVLEDADLMVLPSHTEGLPNAALEALALEVPVLATNVGGTPEVIEDGLTGRLVPARSPEQLAAAIEDFLEASQVWRAWARRGRQLVETQFDFNVRTRKLETIYLELAERSAAGARAFAHLTAGSR